jgi:hypothetical protein
LNSPVEDEPTKSLEPFVGGEEHEFRERFGGQDRHLSGCHDISISSRDFRCGDDLVAQADPGRSPDPENVTYLLSTPAPLSANDFAISVI